MRLGNGKWENTVFNSRLQPTQIGLGNGVNSQNLLKLQYEYGSTASVNNGNVTKQTITVPGVAQPFIQTYAYDELNRLTNAEEIKNSVQQWEQTFTYDRFGNRNFDEANTTTLPKNCGTSPSFTVCTADKKIVNPSVNTANNRLSTSDDYSFDSVGNTTGDASGRTFVYDAENKQVSVSDGGGTIGTYSYDGDGRRIKKYVPDTGETTIFVYDTGGKLIQEHSTIVQTGSNAKTVYTTSDTLGSPRINTDGTGAVISRHDYHPFGDEIATTARVSGLGYTADTMRKQFTGYERDGETGLDFAQARYFARGHGRFTSPDPFNIVFEKQLEKDSEKGNRQFRSYISKPEQWNRYVYAINNPLKFVDPDGREIRLDPSLTEKERNEILYHLQKLTRDKLNWKTDRNGNVSLVITKASGGGQDAGTRLIRRLDGYQSVVTITMTSSGNSTSYDNETNASNGVGSNSIVNFNPNAAPKIGTLDENTGISRSQDRPSWIGLAHELIHADHAARGTRLMGTATYTYKDTSGRLQTATENRRELATVGIGRQNNRMDITENQLRREQGLRVRSEY
jgi:RHS repeat-associated protein